MKPLIRLATEQDAEEILAIYAPFCDATPISFELRAPTVAEMQQRIRKISEQFPWLVCENAKGILGYAYACPHRERAAYRWSVDAAVYVREGQWRSGVGRALYTSLFRILALQGYYKAYAGITVPNPASVGLHEAVGFKLVGIYPGVGYKLGAWRDVGWWELSLQAAQGEPREPVRIQSVREGKAWAAALNAGLPLLRLKD